MHAKYDITMYWIFLRQKSYGSMTAGNLACSREILCYYMYPTNRYLLLVLAIK